MSSNLTFLFLKLLELLLSLGTCIGGSLLACSLLRPASLLVDGSAGGVGITIGLMMERMGMKSEIGMFDVEEELCLWISAREPVASADTWLLGTTLDAIVLGVLPI